MTTSSAFQISPLQQIPDLLALRARFPERYPHFLNSAARYLETNSVKASGPTLHQRSNSRYDILFAFPGDSLILTNDALSSPQALNTSHSRFLDALTDWWQQLHTDVVNSTGLPFTGGWFIYLAYELAAEIEPSLPLPEDTSGLPVALATRFQTALIIDYEQQLAFVISESSVGHDERLKQIEQDLVELQPVAPQKLKCQFAEEPAEVHLANLEKIHQYIVEGDIFQANLSRLWQVELQQDVTDSVLFNRLKTSNPAPFASVCSLPGGSIISSSPERLVSVHNKRVDTRPIAGTRPRGADAEKDQAQLNELISHPKERAEHIMLLDLERNDLGRVCVPGSIEVDELMTIESYQHVHHIVSNVTGQLAANVTPVDVIKAVFPGGTITGCPKVRCMEILAELEKTGRGAYTGSLGYINLNGDMDLNILIRTLVKTGSQIRFRAGGGIVVDSQPENELAETRAKAKGLINALTMDMTL